MIRSLTLTERVHAMHAHRDVPEHGHRFTISATIAVDRAGTDDERLLREGLGYIRDELSFHRVEQMLPGIDADALGIAKWAFERLAGPCPKLTCVRVEEDDAYGETGTVAR